MMRNLSYLQFLLPLFLMPLLLMVMGSCSREMTNPSPSPLSDKFESAMTPENDPQPPAGLEFATLGAGCYWCVEAVLQQVDGVVKLQSGFMGGALENPSYAQICGGDTGHAEVVQVTFDPKVLTYADLLQWFWKLHDPTTLNRQGGDRGTQYRSVIFYHSEAQQKEALASKQRLQESGAHTDPVVTEISAASAFWLADVSHQDYYRLNKNKNPYCQAVITPKLEKLGLEK